MVKKTFKEISTEHKKEFVDYVIKDDKLVVTYVGIFFILVVPPFYLMAVFAITLAIWQTKWLLFGTLVLLFFTAMSVRFLVSTVKTDLQDWYTRYAEEESKETTE